MARAMSLMLPIACLMPIAQMMPMPPTWLTLPMFLKPLILLTFQTSLTPVVPMT
jgi:hypothetical protein